MPKSTKPIDTALVYSFLDLEAHWSVSRTTMYRLINSGLGEYGRRESGNWFFPGRNIERWALGLPPIRSVEEVRPN